MKIMDILVQDAVILDLASRSKRDGLAEMAGRLADKEDGLDAERLHGKSVMELLGDEPGIALVPATAVIEGENAVADREGPRLSIFVAERHPIRTPDHLVEAFARSIPCTIRLSYFHSADDPLLKYFVTPAGVDLLKAVGGDKQAISGRMITRRITRAQRRLEQHRHLQDTG